MGKMEKLSEDFSLKLFLENISDDSSRGYHGHSHWRWVCLCLHLSEIFHLTLITSENYLPMLPVEQTEPYKYLFQNIKCAMCDYISSSSMKAWYFFWKEQYCLGAQENVTRWINGDLIMKFLLKYLTLLTNIGFASVYQWKLSGERGKRWMGKTLFPFYIYRK